MPGALEITRHHIHGGTQLLVQPQFPHLRPVARKVVPNQLDGTEQQPDRNGTAHHQLDQAEAACSGGPVGCGWALHCMPQHSSALAVPVAVWKTWPARTASESELQAMSATAGVCWRHG